MNEIEKYNDALSQLVRRVRNDHCLDMLKKTTNSKLILALLENYMQDSFEIAEYLKADCKKLDKKEKEYLITRYFLTKKNQLSNSTMDAYKRSDILDDIDGFFELLQIYNPGLIPFARQIEVLG